MTESAPWVAEARSGDPRAFQRLMEHNGPWVLADCRYLSGSADDAHDLSQEVFVKAYFQLRRLRDDNAFEGWLKRIKVNHCITHLRRRKGEREVALDPEGWESAESAEEPWDPEEIDRMRDRALIDTTLAAMRDTLRVPLVMHDMDEYSYAEIAQELGLGVSAVKMRIQRGRQDFKARFVELRRRAGLPEREGT